MTDAPPSAADDELGPIDYLAIEFPDGAISGAGFDQLLDLVDRGVIGILDVEFLAADADGNIGTVAISDLSLPDGVDLTVWEGAASGLLDAADVSEVGSAMQAGSVALVVVFENRWVLGLVDTWRREGARLIGDGGLPAADVVAALDATESR